MNIHRDKKYISGVGGKANKDHAKVLYDIIGNSLGIPGNRYILFFNKFISISLFSMYIEFVDLGAANVAHNGTTFA